MSSVQPAANVLLVEGQDDKHVVRHLCRKLASNLEFDCLDKGNDDQLLKAIPVEMKVPGRQAVGILMDADDDVAARWQAVGYRVKSAGGTFPTAPRLGGTIILGEPCVGVWLMPDNHDTGELEDFVLQLLPDGDPVWPLAERFIDDIPQEHRKFPPKKEKRAKLHAWLATQPNPMKVGTAIRAQSLDVTRPAARALADWLTALFGVGGVG